jgi:hypothetical protein
VVDNELTHANAETRGAPLFRLDALPVPACLMVGHDVAA